MKSSHLFIPDSVPKPVDPGADPRFNPREDRLQGITSSWRNWAENREVDQWIHSVASVLDQGWNEQ